MSTVKTGFLASLFSGAFGGAETKVDQRTGLVKTIVTFMTSAGKKFRFVVSGDTPDFTVVSIFSVITVEVTDLNIGKSGEFGNYGDQNFTCATMKLAERPVASALPGGAKHALQDVVPDKKAA